MPETSKPVFFPSQKDLRVWFTKNHALAQELVVGYFKKGSGKPSITWSESVDEALCVGWIDGKRKSIDVESYCIRFTPRRANSAWSLVNVKKIKTLTKAGLMRPEGLAAYRNRDKKKPIQSAKQRRSAKLDPAYEKRFKSQKTAWAFFDGLAPSYRDIAIFWVMDAKREETRERRLAKLMELSKKRQRLPMMGG